MFAAASTSTSKAATFAILLTPPHPWSRILITSRPRASTPTPPCLPAAPQKTDCRGEGLSEETGPHVHRHREKSHPAAERRHAARHLRTAARTQDPGRARDYTLRRFRTASRNLHGQFTPRRVPPDGWPGSSLRRQGAALRPEHGRRLRRPRQMATGFY